MVRFPYLIIYEISATGMCMALTFRMSKVKCKYARRKQYITSYLIAIVICDKSKCA